MRPWLGAGMLSALLWVISVVPRLASSETGVGAQVMGPVRSWGQASSAFVGRGVMPGARRVGAWVASAAVAVVAPFFFDFLIPAMRTGRGFHAGHERLWPCKHLGPGLGHALRLRGAWVHPIEGLAAIAPSAGGNQDCRRGMPVRPVAMYFFRVGEAGCLASGVAIPLALVCAVVRLFCCCSTSGPQSAVAGSPVWSCCVFSCLCPQSAVAFRRGVPSGVVGVFSCSCLCWCTRTLGVSIRCRSSISC
jgi:hypothetical protein